MKKRLLAAMIGLSLGAAANPAAAQFRPYPIPEPPPPWTVVIPPMQQDYNYYPRPYPPPAPPSPPQPQKNQAAINIRVPSTANNIWVDGVRMPTRITTSRVFLSPPLEPGHAYSYTIRASWPGPEGMISQERQVIVRANQTSSADFTQPAP